jgi:hypothetical protein
LCFQKLLIFTLVNKLYAMKNKKHHFVCAFLFCLLTFAASGQDLSVFKDKNRLVLLFTPASDNPDFVQQQRDLAQHADGCRERAIRIVIVKDPKLYQQYGVDKRRFGIAVVGKDGEVKRIHYRPIACADLFTLIDQMPQRRAEIKKKQ